MAVRHLIVCVVCVCARLYGVSCGLADNSNKRLSLITELLRRGGFHTLPCICRIRCTMHMWRLVDGYERGTNQELNTYTLTIYTYTI